MRYWCMYGMFGVVVGHDVMATGLALAHPGSLARGGAVDASVDSTLGRSILQFMTDAEGLAEGLSDTV